MAKKHDAVIAGTSTVYLPPLPGKAKKGTTIWKEWAKSAVIELLKQGLTIADICETLGVTRSWYDQQRARDKEWAKRVDETRAGKWTADWPDLTGMSYKEFAKTYLGWDVYPHQAPIIEALEDPDVNRILVTGFPESGKSTHVSLGYALYAMCLNPDIRIAIVSKSQPKAEDLLHRIKRYLTEPHLYENAERNLIEDFNGFEPPRGRFRWDAKQITIRQRQSGERDPTVQALGIGAQIYGTRIDLLILDDALTLENQLTEDRRDKITSWFLQEAMSRVHRGRVIVCGTRIHPFDNYNEWHQAWNDDPHYRRIKIPAIVLDENGEEQSTWPEYWPLDGGEVWDDVLGGYRFQKGMRHIRDEVMSLGEQRWRLVYQQEDVQDTEAIFTKEAIEKAMDLGANRSLGQVFPEEILVLGVDPAVSGRAAAVLVAYNPKTRVRTIVDIFVGENLGATGIRDRLMRYFWEKYRPQRTVIEVNYAPTIMGDEALKLQAQSYGTVLTPHYTLSSGHKRGSKWDEEYGVAAMAPLVNHGLYVLPSKTPDDRKRLEPLIQDMVAFPFSDVQDALMALWFAEGEMRYLATVPYTPEQVAENRQLPPYLARRMSRSYRRTA